MAKEPPKLQVLDRQEPTHSLLSDMVDGEWLDNQTFPDTVWAVPGIIPEGFSILAGPPKVGKSWLALNIALSISGGETTLGCIESNEPKHVLYLALEDGFKRIKQRTQAIRGAKKTPKFFHPKIKLNPSDLTATIEAFIAQYYDPNNSPVVILDTLGKVMPPAKANEGAYQRDYRMGSDLKNVVDNYPGSALVVIHHDRKAESDDFVDDVSGTHGLVGSADTLILLKRSRHETTGSLKVTGRDVDEEEYSVETYSGIWKLNGKSLQDSSSVHENKQLRVNLADNSREMIDWIQDQVQFTSAEFEKQFGEGSRKYLQRFTKAKRIRQIARGMYSPVESTSLTLPG